MHTDIIILDFLQPLFYLITSFHNSALLEILRETWSSHSEGPWRGSPPSPSAPLSRTRPCHHHYHYYILFLLLSLMSIIMLSSPYHINETASAAFVGETQRPDGKNRMVWFYNKHKPFLLLLYSCFNLIFHELLTVSCVAMRNSLKFKTPSQSLKSLNCWSNVILQGRSRPARESSIRIFIKANSLKV